jgi:hypothetical protein
MSHEDVVKQLKAAVKAVEDAGVPDDLRPAAFSKAADLIAGVAPAAPAAPTPPAPDGGGGGGGDAADKAARKLGVTTDVLANVCDFGDGSVTLHFNHRHLSRPATAMREIGLALPALRQGAGIDDATPQETIRAACDQYGVLDSGNFATVITSLRGSLSFRGTGPSRSVKVTPAGYAAARELVERWASAPST